MAKQQIPNAEDARQALESIQEMAQSARKRAQPPKWFGIVVALLAGSMVALAVADLRKWQVLSILIIGIVTAYQGQKTRVAWTAYPLKALLLAPLLLVPLYILLVYVGQQITGAIGQWPAALVAGGALAAAVYSLSVYERSLFSRPDQGASTR